MNCNYYVNINTCTSYVVDMLYLFPFMSICCIYSMACGPRYLTLIPSSVSPVFQFTCLKCGASVFKCRCDISVQLYGLTIL